MNNELLDFQRSFTKLQKAMIINSLYVVTFSDSTSLHPKEIQSIETTARNLNISTDDSIFDDLMPPDLNYMFRVLNSLSSFQKEWLVTAIRFAVASDGPTNSKELDASMYIFNNIGFSEEKVIEIIKKTDALANMFLR